ncbi:hypothetical protein GCM10009720_12290 [Yaniella flava]|uniref:Uncharacterized protein n=1 Tax=Yaniella flava TaxID=287930 RepID=A0ABP5FTB0_9MICC
MTTAIYRWEMADKDGNRAMSPPQGAAQFSIVGHMTKSHGPLFRALVVTAAFALVGVGCSSPQPEAKPETPAQPTADAIPEPTPTETVEAKTTVELSDGYLTFDIPEPWDTQIEDMTQTIIEEGSAPEFNGHTAHQAIITNPEETVTLDVFANIPWPDVVALDPDETELLHAEPLDIGYDNAEGDDLWLRAVIAENPALGDARPSFGLFDGRFEDEQYILVVAPYAAKADLGDPKTVDGGMTAFITPFSESTAGSWWDEIITIAAGTINQSAAEELTGLEGLEAMQALVETEEYSQLLDWVSSFRVHVGE